MKNAPSVMRPARISLAPDVHHPRAHEPEEHGRREREDRGRGQRAEHVVEDAPDPALEDGRLALLGVVALHHPHAAERLRQAAGDLGVDLAALAEDRPQHAEAPEDDEAEDGERDQGQERDARAQTQHHGEGQASRSAGRRRAR